MKFVQKNSLSNMFLTELQISIWQDNFIKLQTKIKIFSRLT